MKLTTVGLIMALMMLAVVILPASAAQQMTGTIEISTLTNLAGYNSDVIISAVNGTPVVDTFAGNHIQPDVAKSIPVVKGGKWVIPLRPDGTMDGGVFGVGTSYVVELTHASGDQSEYAFVTIPKSGNAAARFQGFAASGE